MITHVASGKIARPSFAQLCTSLLFYYVLNKGLNINVCVVLLLFIAGYTLLIIRSSINMTTSSILLGYLKNANQGRFNVPYQRHR